MARCYIATNELDLALSCAQQALDTAQEIGDGNSIWESQLLLAESYLRQDDVAVCAAKLSDLSEQASDSPSAIGLSGETHRLQGMLALAKSDVASATQHFGSSLSIFELLGDRYRTGRSHFDLGRAYVFSQSELAAEHLSRAINIFTELGARRDLEQAEAARTQWERTPRQQERKREAAIQLITLRLAEAVASRALLLRELAAVVRQETAAKQVMILEPDEEQKQRIVVAHGYDDEEATRIAGEFAAIDHAGRQNFGRRRNLKVITLKSTNSLPATLLISPADSVALPNGMQLDPLLRVVELGMDVCAFPGDSRVVSASRQSLRALQLHRCAEGTF
jgi:tetratricopeptide (TPR) repeat protein